MSKIHTSIRILQEGGPAALTYAILDDLGLWNKVWNTATSRRPFGTNIFEREWDLLIVLDACRPDFLREFTETYPWMGDVGQMRSVGSMSGEWVLKTFTEEYREEIERSAFISRNVWSSRILTDRIHEQASDSEGRSYDHVRRGSLACSPVKPETFCHYERVQSVENQNKRLHPDCPLAPHVLTDRAIDVGRTVDFDRLIVWYGMPHLQFISEPIDWSPEMDAESLMNGPEVLRALRPEEQTYGPVKWGKTSPERVRSLYHQNLALVLAYVDILLQNIDAENTIITADHGESLGENGRWGHPYGYPWPEVKTVPWMETTATDEGTYFSRFDEAERELLSEERQDLLKQMGYI